MNISEPPNEPEHRYINMHTKKTHRPMNNINNSKSETKKQQIIFKL